MHPTTIGCLDRRCLRRLAICIYVIRSLLLCFIHFSSEKITSKCCVDPRCDIIIAALIGVEFYGKHSYTSSFVYEVLHECYLADVRWSKLWQIFRYKKVRRAPLTPIAVPDKNCALLAAPFCPNITWPGVNDTFEMGILHERGSALSKKFEGCTNVERESHNVCHSSTQYRPQPWV
jgi:hypothetical protein